MAKKLSKGLAATAAYYKKLSLKPMAYDNVDRCIAADDALTIQHNALIDYDGPLLRAFEKFNLHPEDPYHWRRLLDIFARELFNEPVTKKTLGRPRTWTEQRQQRLSRHVVSLLGYCERANEPIPNSALMAEWIQETLPQHYKGQNGVATAELKRHVLKALRELKGGAV